jgi:hypothetical protein
LITKKNVLLDNICRKIEIKFGTKCGNAIDNQWDSVFVFDAIRRSSEKNKDDCLMFMDNTKYSWYILPYYNPEAHWVHTPITFVQNVKNKRWIKQIYNLLIDKQTYSIEQARELFEKYDVIVITKDGKTLMAYYIEYFHAYAFLCQNNIFNYSYLCDLIKKINEGRSVYHLPNMYLYKYISSRIGLLQICHYATFLLKTCYYYEDSWRIILNFLVILCNDKTKLLRECLKEHKTGYRIGDYYYGNYI